MFLISPFSHLPGTMLSAIQRIGATGSLQLCYDAGDISSWPGSGQYWEDVSGNNVDAINGTSAGDANLDYTFNGVVGGQSSGESWRNNLGLFRIPLQSWMHAFHKNDAQLTIAGWSKGSNKGMFNFNTLDINGDFGGVAGPGIAFGPANGSGGSTLYAPVFNAFNGSEALVGAAQSTIVPPSNTWIFSAVSYNETTGAWVLQVNGTQETGTMTYSSPSASDGTKDGEIYLSSNGTGGTLELNSMAVWNRPLSASELTALYNAQATKFGL